MHICDRCKQQLVFDTIRGNCQMPPRYKFNHLSPSGTGIFHGLVCPLLSGWEGDLCDRCLISLNAWFNQPPELVHYAVRRFVNNVGYKDMPLCGASASFEPIHYTIVDANVTCTACRLAKQST
jgi:hypothetical protein